MCKKPNYERKVREAFLKKNLQEDRTNKLKIKFGRFVSIPRPTRTPRESKGASSLDKSNVRVDERSKSEEKLSRVIKGSRSKIGI